MRILRAFCALLLFAVTAFAADSPFSGTWKLNVAKSKLFAGDNTTSDVCHVVADDNTIKFKEEVTDDKGQVRNIAIEATFDGKDYPVTGDPDSDTVAYHRNGNTLTFTLKKGGKVVGKNKAVVSPDGQITTVNFTTYTKEKPQSGMAVYEKQPN
jgi:glucose dehydrogenase